MAEQSELFFHVEGKGFGYCVPACDLLVGDVSLVSPGSEVKFKFGKSSFSGSVLSISNKEETILDAIKEKNKSKKLKKDDSFDAKKPRKAVLKAQANSTQLAKRDASGTIDSKSSKKAKRAKELTVVKALKDKSALHDEQNLLKELSHSLKGAEQEKENTIKSDSEDSEGSSSSNSVSSTSSVSTVTSKTLKNQNSKDASLLNSLRNEKVATADPKRQRKDSDLSISELFDSDEEVALDKSKNKKKNTQKKLETEKKKLETEKKKLETEKKKLEAEKKKLETEKLVTEKKKLETQKKSTIDTDEMKDEKSDSDSSENSGKGGKSDKKKGESASESSSDDEPVTKKSKVVKKVVKRNMSIYPGQNFRYNKDDAGVAQLHPDYEVYVKKKYLDQAKRAKSQSQYCRNLLDKVFTIESLKASTLLGYPPRGRGADSYSTGAIPPRLHPDGVDAIIQSCLNIEETNKKWRPRMSETTLTSRLAGRLWEISNSHE